MIALAAGVGVCAAAGVAGPASAQAPDCAASPSAASPAAAASAAPAARAAAVSRARAERIARRHVERRFGQRARVTDSGREDDYGARWEVEVTRADGVEFDVYVSARGNVVRVVRGGRD